VIISQLERNRFLLICEQQTFVLYKNAQTTALHCSTKLPTTLYIWTTAGYCPVQYTSPLQQCHFIDCQSQPHN